MTIAKIKDMAKKNNGWIKDSLCSKICFKIEKIGRKWVHGYNLLRASNEKHLIADFCQIIERGQL